MSRHFAWVARWAAFIFFGLLGSVVIFGGVPEVADEPFLNRSLAGLFWAVAILAAAGGRRASRVWRSAAFLPALGLSAWTWAQVKSPLLIGVTVAILGAMAVAYLLPPPRRPHLRGPGRRGLKL
jgi:hypothetical protein